MPYRFSTPVRVLIVLAVVASATLTALAVLPLASLMGVDPTHLQGVSFQPTFKTVAIVVVYSGSQFLLVGLVLRFLHRRKFGSLGFKPFSPKQLLVGSGIGTALVLVPISVECMIGGDVSLEWTVPPEAPIISVVGHFLFWMFLMLTLNSLKEELVFRAYPIELFNDHPRASAWIIFFVSLVFAAIHHIIEPFHLPAFLSRFFTALVFAYAYDRWRSIWLIVGMHNGTNFLGFLLGGEWKTGGWFTVYYDPPSPVVAVILDLAVKLAALVLMHFVWKKQLLPTSRLAGKAS